MDEAGWSFHNLREMRYDGVLHMTTAAHGAEEFYDLDNPARWETPEIARSCCDKLLNAYTGHP